MHLAGGNHQTTGRSVPTAFSVNKQQPQSQEPTEPARSGEKHALCICLGGQMDTSTQEEGTSCYKADELRLRRFRFHSQIQLCASWVTRRKMISVPLYLSFFSIQLYQPSKKKLSLQFWAVFSTNWYNFRDTSGGCCSCWK